MDGVAIRFLRKVRPAVPVGDGARSNYRLIPEAVSSKKIGSCELIGAQYIHGMKITCGQDRCTSPLRRYAPLSLEGGGNGIAYGRLNPVGPP